MTGYNGMPNGLFGMGSQSNAEGPRPSFQLPWQHQGQPQTGGSMPPPGGPPTAQPSMIQALLGRFRGGQGGQGGQGGLGQFFAGNPMLSRMFNGGQPQQPLATGGPMQPPTPGY